MPATSVDHKKARAILDKAWAKVDDLGITPPSTTISPVEGIIRSRSVTFKYILVTGVLAKCVNRAVHPRALQAASKLVQAYDARSLCHKVVVGFEKEKGNLWGLSNEPFVNKPARHPEHDKNNPQLKDKPLAALLHDVLEYCHTAQSDEVFSTLVYILRVSKNQAAAQVHATAKTEVTYQQVKVFIEKLLAESDGGARLVAAVGTLVTLLNPGFEVRVYSPNVSDKFARTAGDIEIFREGRILSAYECKHRPTNQDDIIHGIKKAKERGVCEYVFVYAAGLAAGQEDRIAEIIKKASSDLDVFLLDAQDITVQWLAALNPYRRREFGKICVDLLRNQLRRADTANEAARLWNALKQ